MKHAFTLIEVMIVVAIIAIITCIAIPNLLENRKEVERQEQLKELVGKRVVVSTAVFIITEVAPRHVMENNVKAISTDGAGTVIYLDQGVAVMLMEKSATYAAVLAEKPQ